MAPTYCPQCGHELEEGEVAGRLRQYCPACHYVVYRNPVPGVAILCEKDDGLVLIRRGHPPFVGEWALPAGYIEADESSEQAAVRECLEETGLDVNVKELFSVSSFRGDMLGSGIVIFYRAEAVGGDLVAGDDAAEARVFALDELPSQIPFRTHREAITRWAAARRALPRPPVEGPVIRPARPEDEPRILALMDDVPENVQFTHDDREGARRRFREKLGFEVLVAELNEVVVGYLVLSFLPALSGLRAWIDDVVVDPAHQRQGLGAALVEAAIQQADLRGATHLFVYTRRGSSGAREFYKACGFDEDGVAPLHIR
jgi:ADP-ribose pyrophosphatase YjhB (NUDIX family)/GNAT superfamily N-acetyltransferase